MISTLALLMTGSCSTGARVRLRDNRIRAKVPFFKFRDNASPFGAASNQTFLKNAWWNEQARESARGAATGASGYGRNAPAPRMGRSFQTMVEGMKQRAG